MGHFSHSLAVVIGINQYSHGISTLNTAADDAREIAQILKQEHQYNEVRLLVDEQASLQALQHLLEQVLPAQVQSDDRLLFYFAGHGIALNGEDGPEGFLIPQDAKLGDTKSYLPMSKLQQWLSELRCRHFLGILDCCFAGAFRWSSTRKAVLVEQGLVHKERFDRFIADPAWQVITSAAYDQTALDSLSLDTDRGQVGNHSPFAAALIEALSMGKADVYPPADAQRRQPAGDGVTTATDLYIYLRDRIEPATEGIRQRQTPGIWPLKKHDKGEYIFLTPGHVLNLPPAPPLDESKNPYRGLQSFEAEQSDLFFGRQALTAKLCEFVGERSLSVVLGASGSGKSSLVKAGLIPALKQQNEESTQPQWQILPSIRPGESPLKALSNMLQETLPGFAPDTGSDAGLLTQYLAAWTAQHPQMKLLLAIDQFEELITLCRNDQEREQFLDGLAQAVATHPDPLRLVLTLRSDFEPQFQDGTLKDQWSSARFVVSPMTRAELREAIEEPASKRVMYFQSDDPKNPLVDQLIDEVAEMPGALPLLSFTLSELYLKYLRRQKTAKDQGENIDRAITESDYRELGGVVRSLTQRADQEYEAARQEGMDEITIRNVMLRMVAVSGGELTRRRVQKSELIYPEPKNQQVQTLIQQFSAARLLVEGLDTENQDYVEPAHDQLVIGWGRIKGWLNERAAMESVNRRSGRPDWLTQTSARLALPWRIKGGSAARPPAEQPLKVNLPLQRELTTAASHWSLKSRTDGNRQAAGFLWDDDPRLPQLEQTQQSQENWFNQIEAQFVESSVTQKRWNIRIRWILVGTAFSVLSGILGTVWYQLQLSQMRGNAARAENLLNTDSVQGLVLAIQAMGQNRSTPIANWQILPEVQSSLLSAVQTAKERNRFQESGLVTAVAFSPDGQRIVSGNGCLRDIQGNSEPINLNVNGSIYGITFSPDGNTIVGSVASETDSAQTNADQVAFWDLQGNSLPLPFQELRSPITAAAFSPDGAILVSGHIDGTISLWNQQGNRIQQFSQKHTGSAPVVDRVAFSPDGQSIFSHSGDGIRVWNLAGEPVGFFPEPVNRGGMSNLSEGNRCRSTRTASPPNGFALYDTAFSFSQNGRYVVYSGHQDRLITLPEGEEQAIENPVASPLAISPDATSFVGADADENLMLRSVNPDGVLFRVDTEFKPIDQPFLSPNYAVANAAFSPDGQMLVTGGMFGDVRIWDVRGISPVKQMQLLSCNREDSCPPIAISSNRQRVAVSDQNGRIKLLDSDGQETGQTIETGQGKIISLEFSANGQKILTLAEDQSGAWIWSLWDIEGSKIRDFTTDSANNVIHYLAVSPDGKSIVQSAASGMTLLNSDGEPLGQPVQSPDQGKTDPVIVAFSPDGQQLVSWRYNQNGPQGLNSQELTCLWTVGAESLLPKPIPDGKGEGQNCQETPLIAFAAFSPDGKTIALAVSSSDSAQNTVSLWDLKSNQIGRPFQAPNVTSMAFSPDGKTIASRGYDGTIRLSNLQGAPIGRPFAAQLEGYSSRPVPTRELVFSPDGKMLISAGASGVMQHWAMDSEHLLQAACNRLQYHPVLQNPASDVEREARDTCKQYVWSNSGNAPSSTPVPVAFLMPTLAPSASSNLDPVVASAPAPAPGPISDPVAPSLPPRPSQHPTPSPLHLIGGLW